MLLIIGGGKTVNPIPRNVRYLGYIGEELYHAILGGIADIALAPTLRTLYAEELGIRFSTISVIKF